MNPPVSVWRLPVCMAALLVLCSGCGSDNDAVAAAPLSCSVDDQKRWLRDHTEAWYLWARLSPRPDPASFDSADAYLQALLYTGTDPRFPADRWSGSQATEDHDRLYRQGARLGYGLSVAAAEVADGSHSLLFIRAVDPGSPAAATQNIYRGDHIVALNGIPVFNFTSSGDYSLLTPRAAGETLIVTYSPHGTRPRSEVLTAAVYPVAPVQAVSVLRSPGGRLVGHLAVAEMLGQADEALVSAFDGFKAAGVQDLVVDLRDSGGGLVATGARLASLIAGAHGQGVVFAQLLHNDQRAAAFDAVIPFVPQASALGLSRVVVITGRRTCGAAEHVINGLRGTTLEVVTIGEATCGKPVGAVPVSACGRTHSIMSFEVRNQRGEGRYFDGIAPTCAVADPYFFWGIGDPNETLLKAALLHVDTGACPAGAWASKR